MLIAQISDSHIALDRPSRLDDLRAVVRHINGFKTQPDLVVHSGDVAHSGTAAEYATAHDVLAELTAPLCVIPGNRDKRGTLIEGFAELCGLRPDMEFVQYAVDGFPLRLICLDTLNTGGSKGAFCDDRLWQLRELLRAAPDQPTAIFMHHPFYAVSEIPDPVQFESEAEAAAVAGLLAGSKNIVAVFCGHVHRETRGRFAGLPARTVTAMALDLRRGAYAPEYDGKPLFQLHHYEPGDGFTSQTIAAGPVARHS